MDSEQYEHYQDSDPRASQMYSLNHTESKDQPVPGALRQFGLGQSAYPVAIRQDQLVAALKNREWAIRVAAVQTLGKQGLRAPIATLVSALRDEHPSVRAAAARALGIQGTRAPVGPLTNALHDVEWRVRAAAALALGTIVVRVPVEPLLALLHDEDESVRAAAIATLGKLGARAPINSLAMALTDPAWTVREAAVLALRNAGDLAPIGALLAARMDEDAAVREAVEATLDAHFRHRATQGLVQHNGVRTPTLHFVLAITSMLALIPFTLIFFAGSYGGSGQAWGTVFLMIICALIVTINIVVQRKW